MTTHSLIVKDLGDGTVESIYCHVDGYLQGVGEMLQAWYTDPAKVDALIALGDLCYLNQEIGEQHNLNGGGVYCGAFHRDGGEDWEDTKPHILPIADLMRYAQDERGAYHIYLYRDGVWMIRDIDKGWESIAQVKKDLAELARLKRKYHDK